MGFTVLAQDGVSRSTGAAFPRLLAGLASAAPVKELIPLPVRSQIFSALNSAAGCLIHFPTKSPEKDVVK